MSCCALSLPLHTTPTLPYVLIFKIMFLFNMGSCVSVVMCLLLPLSWEWVSIPIDWADRECSHYKGRSAHFGGRRYMQEEHFPRTLGGGRANILSPRRRGGLLCSEAFLQPAKEADITTALHLPQAGRHCWQALQNYLGLSSAHSTSPPSSWLLPPSK